MYVYLHILHVDRFIAISVTYYPMIILQIFFILYIVFLNV